MKRGLIPIAVLAVLVALGPASIASASRGKPDRDEPEPTMQTGGQLYLEGSGTVRLRGDFLAWGKVTGMTVRVTDRAGDARIIVEGSRVKFPRRTTGRTSAGRTSRRPRVVVLPPGPTSRISIEGANLWADVSGYGNVELSVSGMGSVRLDGSGTFSMNSLPEESWPLRPITLPLRPTPRPGRR